MYLLMKEQFRASNNYLISISILKSKFCGNQMVINESETAIFPLSLLLLMTWLATGMTSLWQTLTDTIIIHMARP